MSARHTVGTDAAATILLASLGLAAVVALAAAAGALLAVMPLYEIEFRDHCVDLAQWLGSHPEIVLAALPLGLLVAATTRALVRAVGQLRHTRRLMRAIGATVTPSPMVDALARRLDIQDCLDVVANPVPAVFCYGLLRPRICLTSGLAELLDADELTAVLLHERHHVRRRDPARLVAARALVAGVGFLPGAAVVHDHYVSASEMAADDDASELPGGRLALASSILKLARTHRALLVDHAGVSALSTVPGRVAALMAPVPQPAGLPIGALFRMSAGLVVLLAFLAAPVALAQRPEPAALHPCMTLVQHASPHAGQ